MKKFNSHISYITNLFKKMFIYLTLKLKYPDNKFANKNYAKLCKRINKDVTTA